MDDLSERELQKYVQEFLAEFKAMIWQDGLIVAERQKNKVHCWN